MQPIGHVAFTWDKEVKDWEETNLSKASRITFLAIGAITFLIGILILCKVPGLNRIGTIGGLGTLVTSYVISAPSFIKYVKPLSSQGVVAQPQL